MRVRVDSIGCRLNIGEAERIARDLAGDGHRVVGQGERADLFILNTCAVTHIAARKSRKLIRKIRRANPGAAVVVTGCYAELSAGEVGELGVDLIVGNRDKDELIGILGAGGILRDADPVPAADAAPLALEELGGPGGGRTRAFVKVQDGCDNRCTFCIVTVARGDSRSRSPEEVVDEVRALTELGYREVVLSGVHLGSYGHDVGRSHGLEELVGAVLADTDVPRLRLSSLEPWDLRPEFFALWENERLLPHLHLPLQSGCDETLQRMARRTDQAGFSSLVAAARDAIPDLAVTTDIIVGFPGETDTDFADSIGFVEQIGFAKLHVFRYSPREGTAAAAMAGRVAPSSAQARSRRMHVLGSELEARFRRRYLGGSVEVLWESCEPHADGVRWSGLTGNYLRVLTEVAEGVDLANRVTETALVGEVPGALTGVIAGRTTQKIA